MKLNEYQNDAVRLAFFPGDGLVYCALGITGEAGEYADHIKKMIRDDGGILTPERRELLIKELGDVMWYIANAAKALDVNLETVAKINIDKLQDRKKRDVQQGSGDNR